MTGLRPRAAKAYSKCGTAAGQSPRVAVACDCSARGAVVTVSNAGTLPPGFDFARGQRLGTGLALMRSLLPESGAAFSFAVRDGRVEARLDLSPPLLGAADPADQRAV